ncbi:MAG: SRPBCC family protein [Mycobacteriales bacterium]
MAHNEHVMDASPHAVFAVLADGHSYEEWVVGCKRIRAVDASWPNEGASFHHSVGFGPIHIRDTTTVLERDKKRTLRLKARAWPAGVAHVDFELVPEGARTRVLMTETLIDGPAKVLDNPVQQALVKLRNVETLRRLERVVAARARPAG